MAINSQPFPFHSRIRVMEPVDDPTITARVQHALHRDVALKHAEIRVETFAGGVELSGWVDRENQKDRAVVLAAEVAGVSYVVSNLSLRRRRKDVLEA